MRFHPRTRPGVEPSVPRSGRKLCSKKAVLVLCKAASRKRLPTHLRERDAHATLIRHAADFRVWSGVQRLGLEDDG